MELELSREQLKALEAALCAAFPSSADLKRMIRFELGENPNIVAGEAPNLAYGVYNLIEWALAHDKMANLICAAVKSNPDNTELRPFARIVAQFYVDAADGFSKIYKISFGQFDLPTLEEYDMAISNYTYAIEIDEGFVEAYNRRGQTYLKLEPQNYEAAIADYTRTIELNSQFAEAYNNRGDAYRHLFLPNYEAAIADYAEASRIKPDFLEARQNLAWTYLERGCSYQEQKIYDKAIADFNEALKLNLGDAALVSQIYLHRGEVYSLLHKYNEALRDFDEIIELGSASNLDKDSSDYIDKLPLEFNVYYAYFHRGNIYHEQGRYKAALFEYNNAEKLDLTLPELYINRSATYSALGRQEEAEADVVRAQEQEEAEEAFLQANQ